MVKTAAGSSRKRKVVSSSDIIPSDVKKSAGKTTRMVFQISQRRGTPTKVDTLQINCEYVHSGEQWRKLWQFHAQDTAEQ